MKIAFMSSGTIKGSLSYRPLALAKELVNKGHEVYIFAPRFDKYSNFKDEGIKEIEGVKIMRPLQWNTASFELGLLPYIVSSTFMLHKLNPDIIHIFKPNPITVVGLLPKMTRKTPIVLDADDLDSEVMRIENNPKSKIKLVELSERLSSRSANAITGASKYLHKIFRLKYDKKIIKYLPNGANFINTNGINTKKISNNKIIFVGNINRVNILEPLFLSLKMIKDKGIKASIVIVGDGKYLNYFKKLAKKLELYDQITFAGRIPQKRLDEFIKVGDIGYCYMPNELTIKACSSMKVFQYMQFGAVPLVSNVGDLPTYTFDGKAGYIAKHSDIDSLTETLIKALSDKNARRNKANFAIKNAGKIYKWSVLADKVEEVYRQII